jgi:hypothetical protein
VKVVSPNEQNFNNPTRISFGPNLPAPTQHPEKPPTGLGLGCAKRVCWVCHESLSFGPISRLGLGAALEGEAA